MKYFKIAFILMYCCFSSAVLMGQQNYVSLTDSQQLVFQSIVDTLLIKYISTTTFSKNKAIDMQAIDDYRKLFEDEKAKVFYDLKTPLIEKPVSIKSYATDISLKFGDIEDEIFIYPYPRKIELDSIRYYNKEEYYYIPIKIKKILNYSLDSLGNTVKLNNAVNLNMFVNVYNNKEAKIAGIFKDESIDVVWQDCLGIENGEAYIFYNCDDGNDRTINDKYDFDCNCIGIPIDCEGVENGEAIEGTACDDGDKNTISDVYDENCNCIGYCTNDNENRIGDLCNDEDDTTINDIFQNDCLCKGLETDCEGVKDGTALFGTKCDDGNDRTINDIYLNDCTCAGVFVDCLGNENGKVLAGTICDDDNEMTINDVYQNDCTCKGEMIDCEGLVNGPYVPGYECNDKNKKTINDKYQEDCTCKGETIAVEKLNKFNVYFGPVLQLPLANSADNVTTLSNFNVGAKLGILISPHKNQRIFYNVGLAFLPINQMYELTDIDKEIQLENLELLGEEIEGLELNLTSINETLKMNIVQLQAGVSYSLNKPSATNIFIDAFAKPNFNLGRVNYTFTATQVKNLVDNSFGTPLPLINEPDDSSIKNAAIERGFLQAKELDLESSSIEMNDLPFAVGGGLSIKQQLGNKTNYIVAYAHYNYFIIPIGFKKQNNLENIEKSNIVTSLIDIDKLPQNESFSPLSAYFNSQNNAQVEMGITYLIQF